MTMRFVRLIVAFTAAMGLMFAAGPASAHDPGSSAVLVETGDSDVTAVLQLPLDRLEIAVDLPLAAEPDAVVENHGAFLSSYIVDHFAVTGADGSSWAIAVGPLAVEPIDGVDHLVTTVTATPEGAVTDFTLTYDVILDYLLSHEVIVTSSADGEEPVIVATLNHATNVVTIEHAAPAASFGSMVSLGFDHVLEGADHLLFLIVLLLVAPLVADSDRRWGQAEGLGRSLMRVLSVATAFTIAHSLTLAGSALGWISAPSQPVEIVVAASITAGAIHAIRPIVARGEVIFAACFGLVHGLAFAGILERYDLGSSAAVTSLLGFNIGVELAQLLTIALVFPSLYVLSRARSYRVLRIGAASVAAVVSLGWIIDRLGLAANPFAPAEDWVVTHPLVLVAALAAAALISGCAARLKKPEHTAPGHSPEPSEPAATGHVPRVST